MIIAYSEASIHSTVLQDVILHLVLRYSIKQVVKSCKSLSIFAGTSACPNGHFYCQNRGYLPKLLNSSAVDDGICGERKSHLQCPSFLFCPALPCPALRRLYKSKGAQEKRESRMLSLTALLRISQLFWMESPRQPIPFWEMQQSLQTAVMDRTRFLGSALGLAMRQALSTELLWKPSLLEWSWAWRQRRDMFQKLSPRRRNGRKK